MSKGKGPIPKKRKLLSNDEEPYKRLKLDLLQDETQEILNILTLDNTDANIKNIYSKLLTHVDRDDRIHVVIEELLTNQTDNNFNVNQNGLLHNHDPINVLFFEDLELIIGHLKLLNPDTPVDENLVYETLLTFSNNKQRVDLVVHELLNSSNSVKIMDLTAQQQQQTPSTSAIKTTNISDDDDDDEDDHDIEDISDDDDDDDVKVVKKGTNRLKDKLMESLLNIFPDVQVQWLFDTLEEHQNNPDCLQIVSLMMSEKSYPKQDLKAGPTRETLKSIEYDDQEFLKIYPEPLKYFYGSDGQVARPSESYVQNSIYELVHEFVQFKANIIVKTFRKTSSYSIARKSLLKSDARRRNKEERYFDIPKKYQKVPEVIDEGFFKEFWFSRNEDRLTNILKNRDDRRKIKFEEARKSGILFTCPICYDDEVLPDEVLSCMAGHEFCPECVRRSADVAIGDGLTRFPCLCSDTCDKEFSSAALLTVLPIQIYEKVLDKKLNEDLNLIGNEGDSDLVQCPFCVYVVSMPNPHDKILRCRNPDCLKESCRLCKELNHVPLRCEEVEKSSEMDYRKKVEMEMTEAIVRTCPKCNKRFYKVDGCNKMTCSCGTTMCYVCRKPNVDYNHFSDKGCILHGDTAVLHNREILEAAEKIKMEYSKSNPEVQLKFDPTSDLTQKKQKKKKEKEYHVQHVQEMLQAPWPLFFNQFNPPNVYNPPNPFNHFMQHFPFNQFNQFNPFNP